MGQYGAIDVTTWNDRKFRALSSPPPCGQVLWLYLLAPRERIMIPGLIPAGEATISESLRWPLEATRAAMAEILGQGMAELDTTGPLIWLPHALRYAPRPNPNIVEGWGKKAWSSVPECPLKHRAWAAMRAGMEARGGMFLAAFDRGFPEPARQPEDAPLPPKTRRKVGRKSNPRVGGEGYPPTFTGTGPPNIGGEQEQEQEQEAAAAGARARAEQERELDPEAAEAAPPSAAEAVSGSAPATPTGQEDRTDATRTGKPATTQEHASGVAVDQPSAPRSLPVAAVVQLATAALPPRPVAVPDPPPFRPLFVDTTELGPLGAEYRARVEVAVGHGLAGPRRGDGDLRAELEQLLERHGLDRALAWTLETLKARRAGPPPGSVAYLAAILRDMPAPEESPPSCPEWETMLAELERLPPADRLRPETVARWLRPLAASFLRGVLEIEAPDAAHAAFVTDQYLAGLRRLAVDVLGPHVVVQVVAQETATEAHA